jgi:hypothetical protein
VWQAVRTELRPRGLEIVTVALDTGGAAAAGPWIDAAKPEHPSLIDEAHVLDALLGVTNVPMGIWIDEQGRIVRPPEVASPGRPAFRDVKLPPETPARLREMLEEARKIPSESERYMAALRDWVAQGARSRYALPPEEVVRRSIPRPFETSLAAANFEMGQHLHRSGEPEAAVPFFREAHRLQPDNWTYKRQAWSFVDPLQGPSEQYESDWLTEIRKVGAENYYPKLEL